MKAYNYECPKCKFDGETIESKREKKEKVGFRESDFDKYDRIVKTAEDTIECPKCDGLITVDGKEKYHPMRPVGGPLGGWDILPIMHDREVEFVSYNSKTLSKKIHDLDQMKAAYVEQNKQVFKRVASVESVVPEVHPEASKVIRRPGRPKIERANV